MSGCLIVSDVASAAERLTQVLQKDQPHWPLYRASNWSAAVELAGEHRLAWIVLIAAMNSESLLGLKSLRLLCPKASLIWFSDQCPSRNLAQFEALGVRILPEEALDTLFSGLGDDSLKQMFR